LLENDFELLKQAMVDGKATDANVCDICLWARSSWLRHCWYTMVRCAGVTWTWAAEMAVGYSTSWTLNPSDHGSPVMTFLFYFRNESQVEIMS